jgi:uncharacterized membrane protein
MNLLPALVLAFLIGGVAGLRAMAAPAVVAWAAYLGWINLTGSPLAFMGSIVTVGLASLLALAELVGDKLPTTPSRTQPPGSIARLVTGALAGAAFAVAGSQSLPIGAVIGIVGALAGTYGGYLARTGLVRALGVPDFAIAVLEDLVAIGFGFFLASRF